MIKLSTTLLAFLLAFLTPIDRTEAQEELTVRKILSLSINSSINPATLNYLTTGYAKAREEGHQVLLIKMNTPGGLVTTTKDILTLIGDASLPTVIWVRPEGASATSAGAIIAAGAHLLYMAEGTNIGAATPIQMGGDIDGKKDNSRDEKKEAEEKRPTSIQEQLTDELMKDKRPEGSDMRAKAINDLVALVQSLSEARGRNPELFAEMIRTAASFKSREALEKNLINGIVNTDVDLLEALDGSQVVVKGTPYTLAVSNPIITDHEMDLGQKLLDIFANPGLAYILFMIGAALIYLEMQAPGGFIAGSLGAMCLIIAGIGFQVLPVNFGGLGLIVLSFLFFILEIYVTSYGILSLAGLASLISGSLFLYRSADGYIEIGYPLIFSTVAAIVVFMGLIAFMFIKDRKQAQNLDFNNPVGHLATIMALLEQLDDGSFIYQVKVNGEIWRALSSSQVEIGKHVTIKSQQSESNTLEF